MDPTDRIDVFISHSAKNRRLAEEIERILSSAGLTCWIAPTDVPAGADYAWSISEAISRSRTLVVVLTPDANKSGHVAREVNLAVNEGLRIVPMRLGITKPERSLKYLLGLTEWVDLSPKSMEDDLRRFAESLKPVTEAPKGPQSPPPPVRRPSRMRIGVVLACVALAVAAVVVGVYVTRPTGPDAITSPTDGALVGAQETASGTWHGTRGHTLLAVVLTESPQRYYPQDPPISTGWRGAWTTTVYFGEEEGRGGAFELLLVETEDAAPFDEYYRAARASGSWQGLEALPEGATVLDAVRVTRR